MTPGQPDNSDRRASAQSNHARKLLAWVIVQALIPALLVVATGLAAQHFFDVHFAFQKMFVSADLVLVGALLLVTLIVDIWAEQRQLDARKSMFSLDALWLLSAGLTCIAIVCFGFLKVKALQYDFPQAGSAVDPTVNKCVAANIALGSFAIVWGSFVARFAHRKFLEVELEKT